MGIFGDLDAATVSSNPFFVEAGDYEGEVTKSEYRTSRDGKRQLFIEFTITDAVSSFKGQKLQQYFPLVEEGMTAEKFELLPAEEKQEIRKHNANLKRALCGNDGVKNQPGLGVDPNDLNDDDWKPGSLVGIPVLIAVNNYGPNNQGVAVKWANVIRDESDSDV